MKYVIFTEKLKNSQVNTLKKFNEIMINELLNNHNIYIDGVGTFYLKRSDNSTYSPGYNDGASIIFTSEKLNNIKKFEDIKNVLKCLDITKLIREILKENVILDVADFGIFTSKNGSITFSQSKVFKKKLNDNDVVEYIANDDDAYDNNMAEQKIKDYEDLEEIVYDDYINKKEYSNNSSNYVKKEEPKNDIDNTRSIFKTNIENAIKNDKTRKERKPFNKNSHISGQTKLPSQLKSKIFIIVASIVILVISSGIIVYFISSSIDEDINRININESVYGISESFFRTYKSTMFDVRLTKDMYIWEISEELYDNLLYWPLIYASSIITSNPAKVIPKGTKITYRDLNLKGNYLFNISHRMRLNKTLSRTYMSLYPVLLDYKENVHAVWSLRLSSYFNASIFEAYKNTINKDLYDKVLKDTKKYAKRSI